MGRDKIAITGLGLVSPCGLGIHTLLEDYGLGRHRLVYDKGLEAWVGRLPEEINDELRELQKKYPRVDPSVCYAILAAQRAVDEASWLDSSPDFGILIGSSRGATTRWEAEYELWSKEDRSSPFASPTTTLGNISSWVGQDLGQRGFRSSHSITCSTAAHAVVQAAAWLKSGMASRMLVGGAEAPLTTFTLAQMKALRIYCNAPAETSDRPCQPLARDEHTGMVLAEGAGVLALETGGADRALAWVSGLGYAQENLGSPTSIDPAGAGISKAMRMALKDADLTTVDAVVTHAPGTRKGDAAEWSALQSVFEAKMPILANSKWMHGHGLGASAAWSLGLAVAWLRSKTSVHQLPYDHIGSAIVQAPKVPETIMINAMGFGGNCVSIILNRNK